MFKPAARCGFKPMAKEKGARIHIRQKILNCSAPGSAERSSLTKRARLFYSQEHFTQRRF